MIEIMKILKYGVHGTTILTSHDNTLVNNNGTITLSEESNKEYEVKKHFITYNVFLDKVYKGTNIPINIIHSALVEYNNNKITDYFLNTSTLLGLIDNKMEI